MREGGKWIIVCSTMNSRGTAKIANDYLTFFRELGCEATIVSPRLSRGRLYGVIWELGAIYLLRVNRNSKIVLVNGRVPPVLRKKTREMLLVTLDMMNYGWGRFFSGETSYREKINIIINTLLVPGSQGKAKWRSVISKKTMVDLEELEASRNPRLGRASVVYPSGSFTRTEEWKSECFEGDEEKILGIEEDITKAIWITGETRNKGFVKATDVLRKLDSLGANMHVDVLGIRSGHLKAYYEELVGNNGSILSTFRERLSEHELIELYVSRNIALCLSEEEGFGLPFMDAILFGLPVIANRIDTYVEICELINEEGIRLPPVLWIEKTKKNATERITKTIESGAEDWVLQVRDFIRVQEGRISKKVREDRKRNYEDNASLLVKRSTRDLARLIGFGDCT